MKKYIDYFSKVSLTVSMLTIAFMIIVQNAIVCNIALLVRTTLLTDIKLIGYVIPSIRNITENVKLNIVMSSLE